MRPAPLMNTAPATVPTDIETAATLLAGRRVVALTGAGISTDSGIPDYRGPDSPPRRPMTYQEFISGPAAQQRYWARAHVGWGHVNRARPNAGHFALAQLQRVGIVVGLITQNVDGLHSKAGSPSVVELHGRISDVVCLGCRRTTARADVHRRLDALNPGYADRAGPAAPDGDAAVPETSGFRLVGCTGCGGALKPDVVFFGENVPRHRVSHCAALVDGADVLMVVGSSLQVMSGLRFVRRAARAGKPVLIVNRGPTRADDLATMHVDAGCSSTLEAIAAALT
jgi:NAD-dependent SIR2 family protein deacetylase